APAVNHCCAALTDHYTGHQHQHGTASQNEFRQQWHQVLQGAQLVHRVALRSRSGAANFADANPERAEGSGPESRNDSETCIWIMNSRASPVPRNAGDLSSTAVLAGARA